MTRTKPSVPDVDPYKFARRLLAINDLDPIYVALWNASLPWLTLRGWLLAYWCFYDDGTASWVVDQPDYWQAMTRAAGSKDYRRTSVRRHFRGEQALESVAWLKAKGLDRLFAPLVASGPVPARELMKYVQTWLRFGPCVSFKVADMTERLGLRPVIFDVADTDLYTSPRKGAATLARLEGVLVSGDELVPWAVGRVLRELDGYKAPPRYERPLNVQEVETVLCKWHGAVSGHYRPGDDVQDLHTSLTLRGDCPTARAIMEGAHAGGLW